MRSSPYKLLAMVTGVMVFVAAPAAGQLDPKDAPTVTGPLEFADRVCNRQALRAPDGKIGVVTRACIYAYTFDSDQETNTQRNYGVAWLQTHAKPRNGWCLGRVRSNLVNQNQNVSARAPRVNRTFKRPRRFVTRLVSNADGTATTDGVVRNGVRMRRGELRTVRRNQGKTHRLVWKGKTGGQVAFAMGIEMNWRQGSNFTFAPAGGIQTRLREC